MITLLRRDPVGAFCTHAQVVRAGRAAGPLRGLRFAVKDVFAIAGESACFGNPTWLASHPPATTTAQVIQQLLSAGATLAGTTITDELAFSLTGENFHYGTPLNTACPDRVPGGSSSGSAAAVAAGLVDFALGTDTGGSVRVPASHCGLYGFRPTHDAVSTEGLLPFAPRFDTVGWFARDPETLAAVGDVILPARDEDRAHPLRARLLEDGVALLDAAGRSDFRADAHDAAFRLGLELDEASVGGGDAGALESWLPLYLTLQNGEVARIHRDWVEAQQPAFGPLIAPRMARALALGADELELAEDNLRDVRRRIAAVLEEGTVLVLPSACGAPLPRGERPERIGPETGRSLTLSAIASLAGLPQVTVPVSWVRGCPVGLSFVAARGHDRALLALARRLTFLADERLMHSGG
jgi:amidase